jgi:sulfite reductase alpha subunit-like flavoprotein
LYLFLSIAYVSRGISENILYFGCRSALQDQHYSAEWDNLVRAGKLQYRLSCSRDGEDGKAKVYVQNIIEQDAKLVWEVLNDRGGWVYISGWVWFMRRFKSCKDSEWRTTFRSSNKMPAAVKKAIQDAAVSRGGMGDAEAKDFITTLEREGRLFEECWS